VVVGRTWHDNKKLGVQGFLAVRSRAQDSECQQFRIIQHWLTCLMQKAPCANNFRAIKQAMHFSKACDITGIVGIACAWHGCFAPNSIVDLFRGEQQKNVDWSFLECIWMTNVDSEQGIMLIYDITSSIFIPGSDISCRTDWKLIRRSDSSMFMATRRNVLTGLHLVLFQEQELSQARHVNLYGPS